MAEKTSWTDLLADLIRGFVLLRDIFGYILPGFVFLLIGIHSGHLAGFEEFCKVCGIELPRWMAGLFLLVISYVAGHFLVATVFFVPDTVGLVRGWFGGGHDEERLNPRSEEAADLLRYRKHYPGIFIELDRRSILALLRTGLAGSVLIGLIVFYWLYPYRRTLVVVAAAIMVSSAYGANRHIREMRRITLKAARDEETKRVPEPQK